MHNDVHEENDNKSQKHVPQPDPVISPDAKKDREGWVTGTEPMTGTEKSYLKKLSDEAGEAFDENLSRATASTRIDELENRVRGDQDNDKK